MAACSEGEPRCSEEPSPFSRGGSSTVTRVALSSYCPDSPSCREDFESARAAARECARSWCEVTEITGCGVSSLESDCGTHGTLRHFDERGTLIGYASFDDVGVTRDGCVDSAFLAGAGRPSCPDEQRTSLCERSLED